MLLRHLLHLENWIMRNCWNITPVNTYLNVIFTVNCFQMLLLLVVFSITNVKCTKRHMSQFFFLICTCCVMSIMNRPWKNPTENCSKRNFQLIKNRKKSQGLHIMGSSLNDVTQIWILYNTPSPLFTQKWLFYFGGKFKVKTWHISKWICASNFWQI